MGRQIQLTENRGSMRQGYDPCSVSAGIRARWARPIPDPKRAFIHMFCVSSRTIKAFAAWRRGRRFDGDSAPFLRKVMQEQAIAPRCVANS
jgi:hypothetical protein